MTELFDFLEMFNSSLKVKTNSTSQNKPYYLGSSIYIVDSLRIYDLSIDDQSSMLASSIYTVTLFWQKCTIHIVKILFLVIYARVAF